MKEKYNFSKKSGKNFDTLTFLQTPKFKMSGEKRKIKKSKSVITDPTLMQLNSKCRAVKKLEFLLNNNFTSREQNTHMTFEITNDLVDYDGMIQCLNNFMKMMRCSYENIKYIWVLDTNKQGCVHIHMIIDRYFSIDEEKELSKKWHKKVCKYYGIRSNSKICNINFTKVVESAHLESVLYYFVSKISMTYSLMDFNGKRRYSRSRNLEKPIKSNGLTLLNVKEIKRQLEDKYGKMNVKLNSYYDYYSETKIYFFKIYKRK